MDCGSQSKEQNRAVCSFRRDLAQNSVASSQRVDLHGLTESRDGTEEIANKIKIWTIQFRGERI
jgi:hypothetical protein